MKPLFFKKNKKIKIFKSFITLPKNPNLLSSSLHSPPQPPNQLLTPPPQNPKSSKTEQLITQQ